MSATAALAPPPSQLPSILSLGSPLTKRSTESPPAASSKSPVPGPSPAHQAPPVSVSPTPQMQSKTVQDNKLVSPAPVKLPETAPPAVASPAEPVVSPPFAQPFSTSRSPTASPNNKSSISEQAPAQLALLLSSALADADALRRELSLEKKRAARAERLLSALQAPASPNSTTTAAELRNANGHLRESAAKAVVDAESRTEQAERGREDALHALASLSSSFAELERYEAACALRASDARGAYSRLLASLTAAHPPPQSSPALSTGSPRDELRLNLPGVPAPLPSLSAASHLLGPGTHFPTINTSAQSSRYARPLPSHSTYLPAHSPIDGRQSSAFDSLPLPPPPSALVHSSANTSVPSKRTHSHRGRADEAGYEEQKRRRLAPVGREMDVDIAGPDGHSPYAHRTLSRHPDHYQSGPASAQSLSAHPTSTLSFGPGPSPPSTIYERSSSGQYTTSLASGQVFHREGPPPHAPPPLSGSRYPIYDEREREYAGRERDIVSMGLGRVDARELVRDAKARERRGRERESYVRHPQSQGHAQSQGAHHGGERGRRRSVSRSSLGSKSSQSLDEMLLETATDRERARRPSPSEQHVVGFGARQNSNNYGALPPSAVTAPGGPLSASQSVGKAPSIHAPAANGLGRKSTVPASQLMTLGPSGAIVSGGGDLSAPASVDPAVRYPGLRTCRQCGLPGRYKEGKCVEKWGPGPQGPGTVCDRCRKKMKRVERRGTLDSAAPGSGSLRAASQTQTQIQTQKASHASLPVAHSQSFSQSYSQTQPHPSRARAPARTDTLIVETERHPSNRSRSPASGYHTSSVPAASASARHPSLASQTHYATPHSHSQSQSQSQAQSQSQSRRAPTPPYITSISSREQYGGPASSNARLAPPAGHRGANTNGGGRVSRESSAEGEDDLLDDDEDNINSNANAEERERARPANGSAPSLSAGARMDVGDRDRERERERAGYAHSYTRQTHGERDELEDDADGDAELELDADGSGVGDADAEAEAEPEPDADAEIMDAVDAAMKVED